MTWPAMEHSPGKTSVYPRVRRSCGTNRIVREHGPPDQTDHARCGDELAISEHAKVQTPVGDKFDDAHEDIRP